MNERTKESVFLDAINKYAEKQKATIRTEVEEYKNRRIEQATEEGLKDAYDLIQRDIARQKAELVVEVSAKEHTLRTGLFKKRQRISDEVFQKAHDKLIDYTSTPDYEKRLKQSASEIAALFGGDRIIVSLSAKDMRFADMLAGILPNASFEEDKSILIGGLKAYCKEQGALADDTLDTGLADQREWFIENAGLKVV